MEDWVRWLALGGSLLWLASRLLARTGGAPNPAPRGCSHEWGPAEAYQDWDQKCIRCGAWKSGYGRTWR